MYETNTKNELHFQACDSFYMDPSYNEPPLRVKELNCINTLLKRTTKSRNLTLQTNSPPSIENGAEEMRYLAVDGKVICQQKGAIFYCQDI